MLERIYCHIQVKTLRNIDCFILYLLIFAGVQSCFSDDHEVVATVRGSELAGVQYRRPLSDTCGEADTCDTCPFLPGVHVTNTAGTGLVHTAPAHGQDDFRVGLQFSLEGNCAVGEDGRFLPEAGGEFQGLNIFRKGVQRVMEMLGGGRHVQ